MCRVARASHMPKSSYEFVPPCNRAISSFFGDAYETKIIEKSCTFFSLISEKLFNGWAWRVRDKVIVGCLGLGIIADHKLFRYGCSEIKIK
jgi:hypothetical protein